jgi:hypothetical protein
MRLSVTGRVICTHHTDRGGGWGKPSRHADVGERNGVGCQVCACSLTAPRDETDRSLAARDDRGGVAAELAAEVVPRVTWPSPRRERISHEPKVVNEIQA